MENHKLYYRIETFQTTEIRNIFPYFLKYNNRLSMHHQEQKSNFSNKTEQSTNKYCNIFLKKKILNYL